MIEPWTDEQRLAEQYKLYRLELVASGAVRADDGVDYATQLNSSRRVYCELATLGKLDRMPNSFGARKQSKRHDRLVRMYYAYKRLGR